MNCMKRSLSMGLVCLLLIALAQAQESASTTPSPSTPRWVQFSGALKDAAGQPLSGVQGVTFALYKDQSGGAALWLETQNVTLDEQGRYSVLLGSTQSDGLPLELFSSGEARWLGVQAIQSRDREGAVLMEQPRVLLVSVPYALKAADAETLGGLPASAFVMTDAAKAAVSSTSLLSDKAGLPVAGFSTGIPTAAAPSGSGITNNMVKWLDASGTLGDAMNIVEVGGNFGIGTTSPTKTLDVAGTVRIATPGTDILQFINTGTGKQWTHYLAGDDMRYYEYGPNLDRLTIQGTTGNVGIGTNTPATKLDVAGTIRIATPGADILRFVNLITGKQWTHYLAGDDMRYYEYGPNLDRLTIQGTTGYVGIGTTNPTQKLDVAGNVNASGNLTLGGNISASGTVGFSGAGTFTATPTGSGVGQGSLYVNPASASVGQTLLGVAVNGTPKLLADSAGNLTLWGSLDLEQPNIFTFPGGININGVRFIRNFDVAGTYIGTNAGGSNNYYGGQNNTAIGYHALTGNIYGDGITAVGDNALSSNTSGTVNTAIGYHSLGNNTSGSRNTAVGADALTLNSIGSHNTAIGISAIGGSIGGGNDNTAVGDSALYSNTGSTNTAVGDVALANNTTGGGNTGVGAGTLFSNTSGSTNVALGYLSGYTATAANANTTGSDNVFIGSRTGPGTSTQLTNATAIGANAVVSASNALVLGSINGVNGAASSVKVGIGTATPSEALHVIGNILASGTITPSSRRLKTSIQTLQGALEKVAGLRGVSFNWKETGKRDIGLIAEEVGEVVPEVVAYEANGVDAKGMDYARLVSVLIEAVKEQQAQIRQLQSEVEGLKARMGVEVSEAVTSDK